MPHHAVRVPAVRLRPGKRNLRIPEMQQLQGVAGRFLNRDITRDGGHQLQVEFGGKNRGGNGDGIVNAGVSIEEDR